MINSIHSASELRSIYRCIFEAVVQIYQLYHKDEKIVVRYEKAVELTQKLYDENIIDDYIFESLQGVYKQFSTLLPTVVAKAYKEDKNKETEHINKLYELLRITVVDINQVLFDILHSDEERLKNEWKRKNG